MTRTFRRFDWPDGMPFLVAGRAAARHDATGIIRGIMDVQLGSMNRPWAQFTFDEALDGIAGAGFHYFGFLAQQRKLLIAADSSPDEVDAAVAQVRRHGLEPRFIPSSVPMDL